MTASPKKHLGQTQVAYIITCEHGGNHVPREYRPLFKSAQAVLQTHRGWDPGALELAKLLRDQLPAPLFLSETSRLLIDLNRSIGNPTLFSEWSKVLSSELKTSIIEEHYLTYRQQVETEIKRKVQEQQQVIHLSIHSFTPVLKGKTRKADVGVLFDPRRESETAYAELLLGQLKQAYPDLCMYKNSPYRGTADGFTTYLRTIYTAQEYLGIELEINQKYPLGDQALWKKFKTTTARCIVQASKT